MKLPVPAPLVRAWSSIAYQGRHHRRAWAGERIHLEVRGLAPDAGVELERRQRLAAAVESRLQEVPGVRWAVANPVLGRVVVAWDGDGDVDGPAARPGGAGGGGSGGVPRAVLDAVEAAEREVGFGGWHMPIELPEHPADREASWRAASALVADTAGLGLAGVGALARVTPMPTELATVVGLLDSEPHLRGLLADLAGPMVADVGLAVANAAAQGLAHGPVGVLSDMAWRAAHLTESAARRQRWASAEPALCADPALAGATFFEERHRPVPIPRGAVERYADRAAVASVGAAVSAAVATGNPRRAAAGLYAGLPKAARLGREVFTVHLTRWLSSHGAVVLDAIALRRLDRVDTVVVDGTAVRGSGSRRGRRVPPPPWMITVVATARRAGHMVVLAGDSDMAAAVGADLRIDGGGRLADGIRDLQADGCGVLLVADGDPVCADALWSADVAVGLWEPGDDRGAGAPGGDRGAPGTGRARVVAMTGRATARRPSVPPPPSVPWSADVLVARADSWRVIEASATAHEVGRQSVALALLGAAGASAVVFGRPDSERFSWAVNGAALVAMGNATRAAVSLGRREQPPVHDAAPAWHELDGDEVLRLLGSSLDGLSSREAAARVPPERRTPPPFLRLLTAVGEELANPLTPVLAGGAALSAVLGGVVDAGIVAAVTAANSLFGGLQRWRTEQAADSLAQAGDVTVHVRRNGGVPVPVGTRAVVEGDVLVLRAGDVVPADARILEADGVLADESSLTGESLPVLKSDEPTTASTVADRQSMLYGSTSIAAGEAVAVVVATGAATEAGAALTGERRTAGGVEARLTELTRRAIPVSLGAGAAVVAAALLRGRPIAPALSSGVSLAVAAVPEGLPLVATMAQLSAAQRLARQGALVRNHRAIEALGRVDVLCTDKTGTLTMGRLAVRAVSDLLVDADLLALARSHRRVMAAALRATPEPEEGRRLAHPTDASIVTAAEGAGVLDTEDHPAWVRTQELPFEPAQGFHATVGRIGRRLLVSVKGAPEVMLPRCSRVAVPGSRTRTEPLGAAAWAEVNRDIERLAHRGLRVLAVAEGSIAASALSDAGVEDDAVTGLTLLGLVAIADPVRPEAASAVQGLQAAGVDVCMVTGDHPSTAEGIAVELGILGERRVMHGAELATLDDATLDGVIESVSVFARVTPADKVRIVQSFQRRGRVVAMTGDGANDAPAIRLADVGVAMGSRSTPAARQAADVIVTNDDIETIIAAIVEGRALWGSVRDALAILLGGNLGEITFMLAGAFLGGGAPLSTRQLLLVNLLTDVAPALAIATRPPARRQSEELLGEGPDRSLGRPLERAILGRAVVTALGATAAWAPARLTGGPRRASTVALVALVGTQLAQTLTSGGRHPVVLAAGLGSAAVLVGIVQTPGLSQLFGCVPLDPLAWAQVGTAVGGATVVAVSRPVSASLWRRLSALGSVPEVETSTGEQARPATMELEVMAASNGSNRRRPARPRPRAEGQEMRTA